MSDIQLYTEVLDEAVEVTKEIKDIKADINKSVSACLTHGFDRKPSEFNFVKGLIADNNDNDIPTEKKKMYKLLNKVAIMAQYLDALDMTEEYAGYAKDLGINVSLAYDTEDSLCETSITGKKPKKFNSNYASLGFGEIDIKSGDVDKKKILGELMEISQKYDLKIQDLNNVINEDLVEKLSPARISKSTLKSGIRLSLKNEKDADSAQDKLHDIVEQNMLQNDCLSSICNGDTDGEEEEA